MRKTNQSNHNKIDLRDRYSVNTDELRVLVGCGRKSAVEIGIAAGAQIRIGRRVLWNVKKIEKYLDSISGQQEGTDE